MDSYVVSLLFFPASVIASYMTLWFGISIIVKRNDIADIAWGPGFIIVALCLIISSQTYHPRLLLASLLTFLWGMRLAIHIFIRNKNKKEDFRYLAWRKEWGAWFYIRTYLQVFLLQGVFMLLISMPVITLSLYPGNSISVLDVVGVCVWIVGFLFETIGDLQLSRFIANSRNKKKIMTKGLWQYTRHPNYFGEVTVWWGIFLIASSSPLWFIALLSPLTISFLILKVSGIPLLEKKYEGNKEFELYKKRTNAFFPWFPKKNV